MRRPPRIALDDLWPREGRDPDVEVPDLRAERAILRYAIAMFGRHGYGGTSTRAIASAASVTAPLIGYHFGSKEGLFHQCVDVVVGGIASSLAELEREELPLDETVRRFVALHVEAAASYPDALRFALAIAYGPEEGQPRVDLASYWLPTLNWIALRLQRAVDSGEFVPREGTTVPVIVQHLLHSVHFEVFAIHERERFGVPCASDPSFVVPVADPVGEVVAQFFHGAGTLARRPSKTLEGS